MVEDEPTIRQSIAGYLGDYGYSVDEASNGAEGLDCMRRALPDVVVLDLLMPVIGGRAFVEACREQGPLATVPVILLSAAHDLTQATEQLQPRASLAKPIDLDVLLAIVDRVAHFVEAVLGDAADSLECGISLTSESATPPIVGVLWQKGGSDDRLLLPRRRRELG